MVRILAIGDFHGKFQNKWNDIIKKEKIDLVISNGDYYPFYERKIWFEHCYGKEVDLWDVIGKKKYKEYVLRNKKGGEDAIMKLNSAKVPVLTVVGNLDFTKNYNDDRDLKNFGKSDWKWENDVKGSFDKFVKNCKNIKRFDYSFVKFGDYVFIGARGGTNKGLVKSKTYKKHRLKLEKMFKKFKKENKNRKIIFVSHNVPYDTKLDKIGMDAHPKVRGKHLGSKMIRRMIDKWQPLAHIGGHIHESWGKQKIGRTLCLNPGAAHDGKAAVLEITDNKVRVEFLDI